MRIVTGSENCNDAMSSFPSPFPIDNNRLIEILINAIEWGSNVSETVAYDLIRAIGITSDELETIGYDKQEFPLMHDAANE